MASFYSIHISVSGYQETDSLQRCPICGLQVTAEPETVEPEENNPNGAVINQVTCEHCNAHITYGVQHIHTTPSAND